MRQSQRVIYTDPATAEMAKYASNSMLAARISFMNEIARLCDHYGANVDDVRRCVGTDRRIGSAFLFPGLGYGGFCFPKDVQALVQLGRDAGCQMRLAGATHLANLDQPEYFKQLITRCLGESLAGKRLAVWGLAYKARTDDVRMSPAINVVRWLCRKGVKVAAHDPQAIPKARKEIDHAVHYCNEMYETCRGAEALLVMTDWQEFRSPDLELVKSLLGRAVILDGRNLYDPSELAAAGFSYHSIGRPAVDSDPRAAASNAPARTDRTS
jgi:UDPglucose 6-dehydrogenase